MIVSTKPSGGIQFYGPPPNPRPGEECWVIAFKVVASDGGVKYTVCVDSKKHETLVFGGKAAAEKAAKRRGKESGKLVVPLQLSTVTTKEP